MFWCKPDNTTSKTWNTSFGVNFKTKTVCLSEDLPVIEEPGSFTASDDWLHTWKKRHGVRQLKVCRKKLSADWFENRLESKFELYQPREQARFWAYYDTNDYLQCIKTLNVKSIEYNDFGFWSLSISIRRLILLSIMTALNECRINHQYPNIIRNKNMPQQQCCTHILEKLPPWSKNWKMLHKRQA